MKKGQREVYQAVANEADCSLCSFCKYAEFSGYCCDGDIECHHGLSGKSLDFDCQIDNAMALGDCWGFRPSHNISLIADIVGIILVHPWGKGASWWQDKDGTWLVGGVS